MSHLLDTNVVSALRVPSRNPDCAAWVAAQESTSLYVSAFTIAEIERGVAKREREDSHQGAVLRRWFEEQVLPAFDGRVLSFDLAAARALARYRVPAQAPYDDALIAAVAQANQMAVVTRNIRHFAPLGVACVNPWGEG